MKERLFIFLALIILVVVLIGLNAASYVQKEKAPDTELTPNRSTYNTGATGSRAFYDLLSETGRKVSRWQEPPSALLQPGKNIPQTFVVIGSVRRNFEEDEIKHLMEWVSLGGKLVIIDREPPDGLLATTINWQIKWNPTEDLMVFGVDPSDQKQMTDRTVAGKPTQPTVYTVNINAVQPSRLASSVYLTRLEEDYSGSQIKAVPMNGVGSGTVKSAPTPPAASGTPFSKNKIETEKPDSEDKLEEVSTQSAPVVHLANDKKNLLIDFPYGSGKIVYLTDPYIVSNSGIGLVDNARLGINVVASGDGSIVFDEYHQGYSSNKNQLLAYFAGTPVVAIVLQLAVLIGVIFYSQSRRFARAVPEDEPDRLSKLEYVAAMAELQQRTKGFDLAIENIYSDFRRRTARSFGVDNHTTTRKEMANLIAERAALDPNEVENILFKCEDIMHGEPTNKKEVLEITGSLREMEEKLGLQRRKRRKSEG